MTTSRHAGLPTLQSYVSRLRRLLPPSARLVSQAPGYRLAVDEGTTDVDRFEAALGAGLDQLERSPAVALARLDDGPGRVAGRRLRGVLRRVVGPGRGDEARRAAPPRPGVTGRRALLALGLDERAASEADAITVDAPVAGTAVAGDGAGPPPSGTPGRRPAESERVPNPPPRRAGTRPVDGVREPRARRGHERRASASASGCHAPHEPPAGRHQRPQIDGRIEQACGSSAATRTWPTSSTCVNAAGWSPCSARAASGRHSSPAGSHRARVAQRPPHRGGGAGPDPRRRQRGRGDRHPTRCADSAGPVRDGVGARPVGHRAVAAGAGQL